MKILRALLLTTAALLFLATLAALPLPYGFFIFLRIVVCGLAIYTAFQATETVAIFIGMIIISIIFNPIIIIDLPQTTWRVIDLVTAVVFIRLAIKPLKTQNQ